jgi:NADPH2 dehydrogenase
LIIIEATAVESRGRISENDLGLWTDEQKEGLRRVVELCRQNGAKVGIQLAHAGRKGELREEIIAPCAEAFSPKYKTPRAMTKADIADVIGAFRAAAQRAREIGMDVIEIHGAHGYLIHQFLSPLVNRRTDEYGGSLENRMRLLLEVIAAVKEVWPAENPLFLRLSCSDYDEQGLNLTDIVEVAKAAKRAGVDLIDCSSGGAVPVAPKTGPGYQVPFADRIRQEAEIPTAAVGLITEPVQAEEILFNERADLIFLARHLLRDPYWPIRAARALGADEPWPEQYLRAK